MPEYSYGLPQTETDTMTACVNMAREMDDAERRKLLEAAKAIKIVRELHSLAGDDGMREGR